MVAASHHIINQKFGLTEAPSLEINIFCSRFALRFLIKNKEVHGFPQATFILQLKEFLPLNTSYACSRKWSRNIVNINACSYFYVENRLNPIVSEDYQICSPVKKNHNTFPKRIKPDKPKAKYDHWIAKQVNFFNPGDIFTLFTNYSILTSPCIFRNCLVNIKAVQNDLPLIVGDVSEEFVWRRISDSWSTEAG